MQGPYGLPVHRRRQWQHATTTRFHSGDIARRRADSSRSRAQCRRMAAFWPMRRTHHHRQGVYLRPHPGCESQRAGANVTMCVGETGGDASSLVDTVQTVNLSQVSTYDICFFNNSWFSPNNLFGNSSMLVGQRIFIGGTSAATHSRRTWSRCGARECPASWCRQRDYHQRQCRQLPTAQ